MKKRAVSPEIPDPAQRDQESQPSSPVVRAAAPHAHYDGPMDLPEVKRLGARASLYGTPINFCCLCYDPFAPDERGTRCAHPRCTKYYCERDRCCPLREEYMCARCLRFICPTHGILCENEECGVVLCPSCERTCTKCCKMFCAKCTKLIAQPDSEWCVKCRC